MSGKVLNVGVVTMHRVVNYGSFLQAYATQNVIENCGCKCEIIDYIFPNEWHYARGIEGQGFLKKKISNIIYKLGIKAGHRKKLKLEKAVSKYLNLSKSYSSPDEISKNPPCYDVYITGSDQTWNPKHTKGDPTFLLSFAPEKAKKVSFSASIAGNSISDEYKSSYTTGLKKYNRVSIRDSGGNHVVRQLIGHEVDVTLDPTLMMNKEQWGVFSKNEKSIYPDDGYIIFYLITHSFDVTPYIYNILKSLQNKTGLKVFSFCPIPEDFNISYELCSDIGAENFIELFEKSSYVVTSSFHGTAFAVNFGIPLYSVVNNINNSDDRQASLLTKLGIENCLVPINTPFDAISPTYNVELEQKKLDELRAESMHFIREALR